jgi:hypothetical protein
VSPAEYDDSRTKLAETLAAAYAAFPSPGTEPAQIISSVASSSVTVRGADWAVTFHNGLNGPVDVELPGGQTDAALALSGEDVEPLAVADAKLEGAISAALVRSGSRAARSLADAIEYLQAKAPRRHHDR